MKVRHECFVRSLRTLFLSVTRSLERPWIGVGDSLFMMSSRVPRWTPLGFMYSTAWAVERRNGFGFFSFALEVRSLKKASLRTAPYESSNSIRTFRMRYAVPSVQLVARSWSVRCFNRVGFRCDLWLCRSSGRLASQHINDPLWQDHLSVYPIGINMNGWVSSSEYVEKTGERSSMLLPCWGTFLCVWKQNCIVCETVLRVQMLFFNTTHYIVQIGQSCSVFFLAIKTYFTVFILEKRPSSHI